MLSAPGKPTHALFMHSKVLVKCLQAVLASGVGVTVESEYNFLTILFSQDDKSLLVAW